MTDDSVTARSPQLDSEASSLTGAGWALVLRFVFASSLLGLLIGIFEAAILSRSPRVAVLTVPDVHWVIWCVAPLVDLLCFALVGLVLGWLARRFGRLRLFAAIQGGLAFTFVMMMLRWFATGNRHAAELRFFGEGFALSIAVLFLLRNWRRTPSLAWSAKAWKRVAFGLILIIVASAAGLFLFMVRIGGSRALASVAPGNAQAPNIVLITLDTVRADHLSAYGYSRPTTPNIDRFARKGVLFQNAISAAPWTLPSHASMFTGLLPHQHGAGLAVPLPQGPWTLAEVLRSRGYQTAAFVANADYCERGWGLARGFNLYNDCSALESHNLAQALVGEAVVQPIYRRICRDDSFDRRNAAELNRSVFHWLTQRSGGPPFFLFINYFDCHQPYFAPGAYGHRFGTLSNGLARRLDTAVDHTGAARFNSSDRAALIAAYDNCLAYLDSQTGQLIERLLASPEGANTVIIITSDHGEEFGEHGHYGHGHNLYRGVLRVPLIIEGPGIPRGVRIERVARTRELFSTVLNLAGGGKTRFSRTSLARFWNPSFVPSVSDDSAISEFASPWFWKLKVNGMMSITTPDWEYIYDSSGYQQLYSLDSDPQEKTNLADSATGIQTAQQLQAQMVEMIRNSTAPWRGADYLLPLGRPGPFLRDVLLTRPSVLNGGESPLRIGSAQASLGPHGSRILSQPSSSERELLQSLPYH